MSVRQKVLNIVNKYGWKVMSGFEGKSIVEVVEKVLKSYDVEINNLKKTMDSNRGAILNCIEEQGWKDMSVFDGKGVIEVIKLILDVKNYPNRKVEMNSIIYEVGCDELNLMFIIEVDYETEGADFRVLGTSLVEVQLDGKSIKRLGMPWTETLNILCENMADPDHEIYEMIRNSHEEAI